MVEIRNFYKCFVCGGTIIAPNWILTAGHCIDEDSLGQSGNYTIVYGTNQLHTCLSPDNDSYTVPVKTQYRHPNFEFIREIPSNDLGLLELERNISLYELAQPVKLTEENEDVLENISGNITGWGLTDSGILIAESLQKIRLPVISNSDCLAKIDVSFPRVYNETQCFCTDEENNGQCNGDSGGPFVSNGVQYGVISWSLKPCGKYPGVFVRIALPEYRQWIKNITGI
ncbi:hypothetical protein ABEB36_010474 [Hypothenemus hampei]